MGVGLGEMLDRQLLGMLEIHRRVMPLGRSRDVMVLRRRATAKMPGNVDRDNAKFFVGERRKGQEIGIASFRERVCKYGEVSVVAVSLKKTTINSNLSKAAH